ncbi:MAG TPA: four helix bundle protein [Pyrinomonadaceae bacterium]|nr:four helix bundle protein [Pyrinomonadaceae bacterium]
MKRRTRGLGLRVVKLVESLPKTRTADVIGRQLLRCGMSVGANYRSACRAKSRADFAAKMGIVEEEADEICYWIEMLIDCELVKAVRVEPLLRETNEIISIVVSSIKTARANGSVIRSRRSAIRIPQSEI